MLGENLFIQSRHASSTTLVVKLRVQKLFLMVFLFISILDVKRSESLLSGFCYLPVPAII